jgi:hypothetical protein
LRNRGAREHYFVRMTTFQAIAAHQAQVGALTLRRALPRRDRRMVGPWCFLDRYGPLSFRDAKPMDVAPHPHIGIQTVSWLLAGEVLHRDSLGCEAMVRPGGVNLMTSGGGIAHSEETPREHSGRLSGVQLWIALPEVARHRDAAFEHHHELPRYDTRDGSATVVLGAIANARSPAGIFSPLVCADLDVRGAMTLPLDATFEHALLVLDGEATFENERLVPDVLYYLGSGRDALALESRAARVLLFGGAPLVEPIVMWWNFVARTPEEIAAARDAWQRGERFGQVRGYDGPRLDAPPLHRIAPPPAAS